MSSASASGCPWKLPAETTPPAPSEAKTSGLSVTLFSSVSTTPATYASASRLAPWTWGTHRTEYGSWTRSQSAWLGPISEPSNSARTLAAVAACPGCGRRSATRASNGHAEPSVASSVIAATTSAVVANRPAR